MRKNIFTFAWLFLNFIFFSLAKGQASFYVSPQLIELDLIQGSRKTVEILLTNENKVDTQRFRIFASDFIESEDGAYKILDSKGGKFSCADWIKLDTLEIVLGPKKGNAFHFEIRAPMGVKGSYFAAIVFALVPKITTPRQDTLGAGLAFNFQIPCYLEIMIKSSIKPRPSNVEITGIELKPVLEDKYYAALFKDQAKAKDAMIVKAVVNNKSDNFITGKGHLLLTDYKGRRLRELPLGGGAGKILPQTKVNYRSVIKRPLPGDYVLEAIINYGGTSPAIARMPFSIARSISTKPGSFLSTSPVGLIPSREMLDIVTNPKTFRTQIITLSNEENKSVKVKTKLKYLCWDEMGEIVVADSGDDRFSCIKWLTIEPEEFEVQSGATKAIKVTFEVPDAIPGGRYACIFMEASVLNDNNASLPTPIQIPVILTLAGMNEKKIEITRVDVSKTNPPNFMVYLKNLGNIHIKPRIKIELSFKPKISDEKIFVGEIKPTLVGSMFMKDFPVPLLPGAIAKLAQDYDRKLDPGDYTVVVSANFGGAEPAVFVQKFQVK